MRCNYGKKTEMHKETACGTCKGQGKAEKTQKKKIDEVENMVKVNPGNFLLIGIMAALFILLLKSVVGVFNTPESLKSAVYAI